MNCLGLLPPSSLDADQKELYDIFTNYTTNVRQYDNKIVTKLQDGRFVGPFDILLHTPTVGRNFHGMVKSLANIPGLPTHVREVAILVVGFRTQAAYELYAHTRLCGFSEEALESISKGICPEAFDEQQKVAFQVATELGKPGPLDGQTWDNAKGILGVDGATALVHYVGFYSYVSTILNGFNAQIPE